MQAKRYSWPQSLSIPANCAAGAESEVSKQIEADGGGAADELAKLMDEPPDPHDSIHKVLSSTVTTEQSLLSEQAACTSVSQGLKASSSTTTVPKANAASPPHASGNQTHFAHLHSRHTHQTHTLTENQPSTSMSSNAHYLISTPERDTLRNPTDRSHFDILVEGIPEMLWDDDNEESLKILLVGWTPSASVKSVGDTVSDVSRVGNNARCKIHTTLLSMVCFHFCYL